MSEILLNGDSKERLKDIQDGTVDYLLTDPPYGISFMGKNWDKALPDVEIWKECYRVLKPGSFISVMSSPRSDVLYRMIKDLEDAGFDMSFSPILWTYHTGFPKASDTSKMIDKRLGVDREVVGKKTDGRYGYEFNSDFNTTLSILLAGCLSIDCSLPNFTLVTCRMGMCERQMLPRIC